MNEIKGIQRRIRIFRDGRDWMLFHNPKNLACSISIEAAELLEHFQWATSDQSDNLARSQKDEISHEIADVAIYLMELADNLEIDLAAAIRTKLALNGANYPISKTEGSAKKYDKR